MDFSECENLTLSNFLLLFKTESEVKPHAQALIYIIIQQYISKHENPLMVIFADHILVIRAKFANPSSSLQIGF